MRESGAAMQADVLHGDDEFPPWRHFRILAPPRQENVNCEDDEVSGQNAQSAAREEAAQINVPIPREWREELAADQVSAEDEEKIDTNPAEAMHATGERKTHDTGVVNNDDDDGKRTEKIETRLTLTFLKPRIHHGFVCG